MGLPIQCDENRSSFSPLSQSSGLSSYRNAAIALPLERSHFLNFHICVYPVGLQVTGEVIAFITILLCTAHIHFSTVDDITKPAGWYTILTKARQLLYNFLDISVPVVSAVNGPAPIHGEYALMADIILAAEEAYFQDNQHLSTGVEPLHPVLNLVAMSILVVKQWQSDLGYGLDSRVAIMLESGCFRRKILFTN